MFRAAAIVFILSILLTTVASPTSPGANHEQGQPEHIFEGYVSLNRENLNDGFVRVTVGPGYGLQPPVQEVALEDIRQGRYEIGVVDPTDGKYSNVMLRFSVTYEGREYQRPRDVRLEPGKFTELNFDIEDWKWSRAQPQQVGEPSRGNDGMTESQKAKLEMERERLAQERARVERRGARKVRPHRFLRSFTKVRSSANHGPVLVGSWPRRMPRSTACAKHCAHHPRRTKSSRRSSSAAVPASLTVGSRWGRAPIRAEGT